LEGGEFLLFYASKLQHFFQRPEPQFLMVWHDRYYFFRTTMLG